MGDYGNWININSSDKKKIEREKMSNVLIWAHGSFTRRVTVNPTDVLKLILRFANYFFI